MSNKLCRSCKADFAVAGEFLAPGAVRTSKVMLVPAKASCHDINLAVAYFRLHPCCEGDRHGEISVEARASALPGIAQYRTRTDSCAMVSFRRFLRCKRFASGPLRNAASRSNRWSLQGSRCRFVWRVTTDVLSSRGRVRPSRPGRAPATTKGPQGCAQTHRRRHGVHRAAVARRWRHPCENPRPGDCCGLETLGSSSKHRAGDSAQKKGVEALLTQPKHADAVALYESLRTEVIAGQACSELRAALRFHGMLQGLIILLKTPTTPVASALPPTPGTPCNHPNLVRLLANFVLRICLENSHVD